MPPYPGFIGPSNQSASYTADNERTMNLYPEVTESVGVGGAVLQPCPGFLPLASVTTAPSRATWNENGRVFEVAGYGFYELVFTGGAWSTTLWGTVANDGNPATICSNGQAGGQLFITAGGIGYIFSLTGNTLTPVLPGGAAYGANFGGYVDEYFLALDTRSSTLQISAPLNGLSWNPAQVAQRSNAADPWRALYVVNRLIYLLGEHTSEIWYDAGAALFPFAPIQEAFMQEGIGAPYSGCRLGQSLVWVNHNEQGQGSVVQTTGYVPGRISTAAIEGKLQADPALFTAVGGTYLDAGHQFYVLTTGTATWVYDALTQLWHERGYWNTQLGQYQPYRAMHFCSLSSGLIAGDLQTGSFYQMSTAIQTEVDGTQIRRLRQPPRFALEQRRFTVPSFEILLDVGQGIAVGQGQTPYVMLQVSKDRGQTWGNEHWRSAGAQGAFGTRVVWRQLGQFRNFEPRLVMSDPVPWRLVEAQITVTPGLS
jgi:hypothetical protein